MRKHLRVHVRVALAGRAAWREKSMTQRYIPIGKAVEVTMPAPIVADILAAGRPMKVYIQAVQLYDAPDSDAVYLARRAMLALAPPDLHDLFAEVTTLHGSWEAWDAYWNRLVAAVLARAQVVPTSFFGNRAPCPLCGAVSLPPGPDTGFAFPAGLTWHLEGHGNTQPCPVTLAIRAWFRDTMHSGL